MYGWVAQWLERTFHKRQVVGSNPTPATRLLTMNTFKKSFIFSGIVKKNLGRGSRLGFPTANIDVPSHFPEGIFVGFACFDDKKIPSLIFIGAPITFQETDKKAEVYLLLNGASIDLYDTHLSIEVEHKIRDNKLFDSKEDLIRAIQKDERTAKSYFLRHHSITV